MNIIKIGDIKIFAGTPGPASTQLSYPFEDLRGTHAATCDPVVLVFLQFHDLFLDPVKPCNLCIHILLYGIALCFNFLSTKLVGALCTT